MQTHHGIPHGEGKAELVALDTTNRKDVDMHGGTEQTRQDAKVRVCYTTPLEEQ